MLSRARFAALSVLLLLAFVAVRAGKPAPAPAHEIIVSAANYAQTPPDVLEKLFRKPADLPDAPPPTAPTARPLQQYQFLRGEVFESDLAYDDVCKLLVPALATKNLRNTFDQSKVDLVLRVSFGGRRWRDPFVREGDLEWKHGLVPRRRGAALSATAAWDDRAGGDEAALRQTEQTLTEMYPNSDAEGMADRLIGGLPTEDYFLVVVDAFEVAALKAKGNHAPREVLRSRRPDDRESRALFRRNLAGQSAFPRSHADSHARRTPRHRGKRSHSATETVGRVVPAEPRAIVRVKKQTGRLR
jgi:hypothetical protein